MRPRLLAAVLLMALAATGGCARTAAGPRLALYAFLGAPAGDLPPDALLPEPHRPDVSYLVPSWYLVRPDGSVEDRSDPAWKELARRAGLRLLPSFVAAEGADGLLANPAARSRAVNNVVGTVAREGFAGANLSFVLREAGSRDAFTAFVGEVARQLHAARRTLTVTVRPDPGAGRRGAYDWSGLGRRADALLLLAYSPPGAEARPGPIAPLEWVEEQVRGALRAVGDPSRVVLGLAAFGYDWPVGEGGPPRLLPADRLEARAATAGGVLRIRDGSPHYSYVDDSGRHEVWFEDGLSLLAKLRLAKRVRLGGVAVWQLGFLGPDLWEVLSSAR